MRCAWRWSRSAPHAATRRRRLLRSSRPPMRRCRRFCRTGARGRHLRLRCVWAVCIPIDVRACMPHQLSAACMFCCARFSRQGSIDVLAASCCWSVGAAPPCCHVRPFPCRLWSWRLEMDLETDGDPTRVAKARVPASPHHAPNPTYGVRGQPYVEAAQRQSSLLRRRQRPIIHRSASAARSDSARRVFVF